MNEKININEFYQGLDNMFGKQNSAEIEQYFLRYLNQAQEVGDKSGITAVLNEFGGFCRASGKLDRAKEIYVEVIANLEQLGLSQTEHYAAALINAGDVFISAKEYQDALNYFLKAKSMLEQLKLTGEYRMAALYNNISAIYRELGNLSEAEKTARQALDIITTLPDCKIELATTYITLAEVQIKQQKLEIAKENLQTAMKLYEEETDGKDVHYSAANAAMGEVYYYQENYRDSELYYKKALELIERDFGKTVYYEAVEKNLNNVQELLRQSRGF